MEELYVEEFFRKKNGPSIATAATETRPSTPSQEKLDARSQLYFFLRLLKEDVEGKFPRAPHLMRTLKELEDPHLLEQEQRFIGLLDQLEEFLDLEVLKSPPAKTV